MGGGVDEDFIFKCLAHAAQSWHREHSGDWGEKYTQGIFVPRESEESSREDSSSLEGTHDAQGK